MVTMDAWVTGSSWVTWTCLVLTWIMIGFSLFETRRTRRAMRHTSKLHAETVRMFIDAMREVTEAPMVPHDGSKVTVELDGNLYTRIASMIAVDDTIVGKKCPTTLGFIGPLPAEPERKHDDRSNKH